MKKVALILMVALLVASCSGNGSHSDGDETQQVAAALYKADGIVHELDTVGLYTPGLRVPNLTVLYFNAVWCGPCRQLKPVITQLATDYQERVTFVSIDVDTYDEVLKSYNEGSDIPVVILIKPDGTTASYSGTADLLPADKFSAILDAALH